MNSKTIICTILFFLLAAAPLTAEYYQYVDKDGVKHFTDNLLEVPADQRKALDVHQSIKSKEVLPDEVPEDGISREVIEEQQAALVQEYNLLLKKKQELAEKQKTMTPKAYNVLAAELNDEILKYSKKKEAFDDLANQYQTQEKAEDTQE